MHVVYKTKNKKIKVKKQVLEQFLKITSNGMCKAFR